MADENFYLKKAIDLPEYTGDIDDVDIIAVKTNDGYMKRVKTSTTIATKADKDADATAGDVAVFDENGNPVDGGVALDDLAKTDGSYASMAVGVADNLAGRGSVEAMYTFRTSGGTEDIGTGTATIEKMKGNTIAWNQLVQNGDFSNGTTRWAVSGGTAAVADNKMTFTISENSGNTRIQQTISIFASHKYLVVFTATFSESSTSCNVAFGDNTLGNLSFSANTKQTITRIYTAGQSTTVLSIRPGLTTPLPVNATVIFEDIMLFDLTLMFGAGNEPSTVAEFKALYPLNWYDYNAGELVSNKAAAIKTIGFNQWDEEWELGTYSDTTGQKESSTASIRSKNFIKVFPSTNYYVTHPNSIWFFYYDASYNLISYEQVSTHSATTPSNCYYITFKCGWSGSPLATYNNDICINLSWSGYRNGEYEPYEEHTTYLNGSSGSLATLTGKLNGEGESVTIYPDGMADAGSVYDYLHSVVNGKFTKGTKVIGSVDLGSLDWVKAADGVFMSNPISLAKSTTSGYSAGNIVCARYTSKAPQAIINNPSESDNTIGLYTTKALYACNSLYTDATTFKTAMNGVMLYYELATPLEYTLDTPVPTQYPVNDFGTEQRLPADTADEVTAPIEYSVKYALNAVDQIRRLPVNYISKESFENFCTELASKLGTALNATITITPTYDSTDGEYDYSITITPNGE